MSEPTTSRAARRVWSTVRNAMLIEGVSADHATAHADIVRVVVEDEAAIEQEARANADRELRAIAERGVDARRYDLPDGGIAWRDEQAKADDAYLEALAASEQESPEGADAG